jgi:type IV secretion system protein VirB10
MMRFPFRKGAAVAGHVASAGEGPPSEREGSTDSPGSIPGERGPPIVTGARSLQSRMSSLLAAAMMITVGAGMLAWYYAEALSRPAARGAVHASALPENVGAGMTLPSFAAMAAPPAARSDPSVSSLPPVASVPSAPPPPVAAALPLAPLLEPPLAPTPQGPRGDGAAAPLSPRQRALDRRLSGEVLAGAERGVPAALGAEDAGPQRTPALAVSPAAGRTPAGDPLRTMLRPGVLQATRAQLLPTQRLLLAKGTFIDCTLETAIDSTLPGMTTCVTATDTFGADGTVVLLERGTKLIGETRGEVTQGQTRVFVVWTQARTPTGVVVQLDSPGTDAIGRSGLEGKVNRHFWQRFGAAALVSTIDGAVQAEVQSSARGGTVVLDPTASEDVLTEILRSTINMPPTIRVRNGARIQVLVARDVDFRPVYELQASANR